MLTLQKMPKGLRYQKTCMVVYYDIYIGTGLVLRLLRMLNSGVCTDLNWIIEIIAGLKDLASRISAIVVHQPFIFQYIAYLQPTTFIACTIWLKMLDFLILKVILPSNHTKDNLFYNHTTIRLRANDVIFFSVSLSGKENKIILRETWRENFMIILHCQRQQKNCWLGWDILATTERYPCGFAVFAWFQNHRQRNTKRKLHDYTDQSTSTLRSTGEIREI